MSAGAASAEELSAPSPPLAKKARKKTSEAKLSIPDRQLIRLFWEGCVVLLPKKCHMPNTTGGPGRLTWSLFAVRHALAPPHPPPPALGRPLMSLVPWRSNTSICWPPRATPRARRRSTRRLCTTGCTRRAALPRMMSRPGARMRSFPSSARSLGRGAPFRFPHSPPLFPDEPSRDLQSPSDPHPPPFLFRSARKRRSGRARSTLSGVTRQATSVCSRPSALSTSTPSSSRPRGTAPCARASLPPAGSSSAPA